MHITRAHRFVHLETSEYVYYYNPKNTKEYTIKYAVWKHKNYAIKCYEFKIKFFIFKHQKVGTTSVIVCFLWF